MACILKVPSSDSVGVITVTTQERDRLIANDPALRKTIEGMKGQWLIGLHHNWHDYNFSYDPLFDFSMAGEDDLREISGREVPLVPMDACNFVPKMFKPSAGEKFWDILYVARAVQFKRIPEFFQCIRDLYDAGHKHRVLFICPVPPYDPKEEKTVFYKIREVYDQMFSGEERDLFNLLTIDYRYPFPFDLETLGHFYRSSKIFVHSADDERRCRVAAYAWASGIPVVGMDCVAGLLPTSARKPPYFFEARNYADFPAQINLALESASERHWDRQLMRSLFTEEHSTDTLNSWLAKIATQRGLPYSMDGISRKNLSIRLGRHHLGLQGPNTLNSKLDEFVGWISQNLEDARKLLHDEDPERLMFIKKEESSVTNIFGRLKNFVTRS
jgi:glycosyltransferase involved in cell wall biosynthesis